MTSIAPPKIVKAATTHRGAYTTLAELLAQEVINAVDPSPERASNVLLALGREWVRLLDVNGIGRALARAIRSCKQHGSASNKREGWEAAEKLGGETLASMKAAADKEARAQSAFVTTIAAAVGAATGLPSSITKFRARLVRQGKEMYNDPPLPPPGSVVIKAKSAPPLKQNTLTGEPQLCALSSLSSFVIHRRHCHPPPSCMHCLIVVFDFVIVDVVAVVQT
jgi:hypothetical protein